MLIPLAIVFRTFHDVKIKAKIRNVTLLTTFVVIIFVETRETEVVVRRLSGPRPVC